MNRTRIHSRWFWGLVFLIIGGILLLHNLHYIDIRHIIRDYWPLILILIGIRILVHRGHHFNDAIADDASEEGHPSLNLSHTFGDVRLKVDDKDFKGGAVDNIFGNIEIDLEEAEIKEGSYRLHLSGIFGDQNIILPKNQAVSIEAGTSFGTVRIKDRNSSGFSGVLKWSTPDFTQSERRLHIQVKQVFGDIRVF